MNTSQKVAALCALFALRGLAAEPCFPEPSDGQRAKFEVSLSGPLGASSKGTSVTMIDGTERIAGKQYYKEVTIKKGLPGATQEVEFVRYAKDGIFFIREGEPTKEENCRVSFPVEVGKKWTYKGEKFTFECRIIGEETVYTEEKVYKKCIKIEEKPLATTFREALEAGDLVSYSYYAPNVGLVKQEASSAKKGVSISAIRVKD